ncbi:hypothetical protein [Noviherbaspirillum sedimenti]|uniref:Uncharacterized protein n=1 Tax=Noviherbaspirillum sedimenti TaxID=2320865 RepID=A0A3A3FXW0_9BURK|nr:hypothetical protein [Noviherbaspirillum sedimenti]RJG01048.1 hypothetical protein D3878_05160 [Noviherbaspirillum sedimenti]
MNKYKQIDLNDAVAGMTLWGAVLDGRGGVLLPDATVLTDGMITSLRRRGIDMAYVINDDISEADLQAERERVQQRLAILFRKCSTSPACGVLLQRIAEYKLGEMK